MKQLLLSLTLATFFFTPMSGQFEWIQTNAPVGGECSYLEAGSDYIFMCDEFNVYRTDGIAGWEKFELHGMSHLFVNETIVVGLQGYWYDKYEPTSFQISYDNGLNWVHGELPEEILDNQPQIVAIHAKGIFFMQSNTDILYHTVTEGHTWHTIPLPEEHLGNLWVFDNELHINCRGNVYRFDYDTQEWTNILLSNDFYIEELFIEDSIIIITGYQGIWASTNSGQTWQELAPPLNITQKAILTDNNIYINAGSDGILHSNDAGKTWSTLPIPENSNYLIDIATINDQILYHNFPNRNIMKYNPINQTAELFENGLYNKPSSLKVIGDYLWSIGFKVNKYNLITEEWETTSIPKGERPFRGVAVSESGVLAVSAPGYVYVSEDDGETWQYHYNGHDEFAIISEVEWLGDNLFIRALNEKTTYSTDLGQTFKEIPKMYHITTFNGSSYSVGLDRFLYQSNDYGLTWEKIELPFTEIHNCFSEGEKLFIGVRSHNIYNVALFSTEDLEKWQYSHQGLPITTDFDVKGVSIFFHDGDYYARDGHGFYISYDGCKSWESVASFYGSIEIHDNRIYRGSDGVVYSELPTSRGMKAQGVVFNDLNNNGIMDTGELPIPDIKVDVKTPLEFYSFYSSLTDPEGKYQLDIRSHLNDTISLNYESPYIANVNPPYYTIDMESHNLNFGIHFTENITDVNISGSLSSRAVPNKEVSVFINYKNLGTINAQGKIGLKLDSNFEFISANPIPVQMVGTDSLVWNFDELGVYQNGTIRIFGKISSMISLGTPLFFQGYITPDNTDIDVNNNHFIISTTAENSHQPIEKTVEPKEFISEQEILEGKDLVYTIFFQNQGAEIVRKVNVIDQLFEDLDLSTFRVTNSSHPVTKLEINPGRVVNIEMDNIELMPQTISESESQGFVSFAVKRNKDLKNTKGIWNNAGVFFDDGVSDVTNFVLTLIQDGTVSTNEQFHPDQTQLGLTITPNPAQQFCSVQTEGKLQGEGTLTIYDTKGQICRVQQVEDISRSIEVNMEMMAAGLYFITVKGEQGTLAGKVVKN